MRTERTKVDWCFTEKAKELGYWYYVNDLIANISKNENIYSGDIDKHKAKVEFSTNEKEEIDDLECDCSFYEYEDNFCPHVYALVCYAFKVLKETSEHSIDFLEKYNNLNKVKEDYDREMIDTRDDNLLIDKLDRYIGSMPIDVLQQAREQTILEGQDTSILDKEIVAKLAQQKKLEEEKKLEREMIGIARFAGFIDGLHSIKDSKQEQKNIAETDYEPYQFEEEELEDDDYYYEDDNEK